MMITWSYLSACKGRQDFQKSQYASVYGYHHFAGFYNEFYFFHRESITSWVVGIAQEQDARYALILLHDFLHKVVASSMSRNISLTPLKGTPKKGTPLSLIALISYDSKVGMSSTCAFAPIQDTLTHNLIISRPPLLCYSIGVYIVIGSKPAQTVRYIPR